MQPRDSIYLTRNNLHARIMRPLRRIAIVFGVLLVVLSLVTAVSLGFAVEEQARGDAMTSFAERVNQTLQDSLNDVAGLANSAFARAYNEAASRAAQVSTPSNAFTDAQLALMRSFDSLIENNSQRILALRYVTRDNTIWGEADNVDGQVALLVERTPITDAARLEEVSAVYNSLINQGLPYVISAIKLSPNDTEYVTISAPITDTASTYLRGYLQADVSLAGLIAPIYELNRGSVYSRDGRRLLVLDRDGNLLASSLPQDEDAAIAADIAAQGASGLAFVRLPQVYRWQQYAPYEGANLPWRFVLEDNLFTLGIRSTGLPALGALLSIAALIAFVFIADRLLKSGLTRLTQARALAEPLVAEQPTRAAGDEVDTVLQSLQVAHDRIAALDGQVRREVRRRQRDLEVASRIVREIATLTDLDTLMDRVIGLISQEFEFYHTQIFLVDDARQYAVLVRSQGEAGERLIAAGHKILIGSNTVIGTATVEQRPVIINDTDAGGPHAFNALLPETRAEMGLPLVIGGQVIGVLDVQSREPGAFTEEDLPAYTLLADQIAVAVNKARLLRESAQRVEQIDRLNRQLTRRAWSQTDAMEQVASGVRYDLMDVHQVADDGIDSDFSVPIAIRGEVIGSLGTSLGDARGVSEGDRQVLRAVGDRVALAIENARLFQETQNTLSETSTLYQLSRYLNETMTLEDVLQAVIISTMPDASGGQICVFDPYTDRPQSLEIRADLALTPRAAGSESLTGVRMRFDGHPLLEHLKSDAVALVGDTQTDPRVDIDLRTVYDRLGARASVLIPLNVRANWLGVIVIEFADTRTFSQREMRIYHALMDQLGIAIDNRLLLEQTERALARNESLYAASRMINTAQSFADLVQAVVATNEHRALTYRLALLEGEIDASGWPTAARTVAESRGDEVFEVDIVTPLSVAAESPLRQRRPEVIQMLHSGQASDGSLPWLGEGDQPHFVAVFPLFSGSRPIALFTMTAGGVFVLSQEDTETYLALTSQMSTQIENRRLLERTERSLDETRRLFRATTTLSRVSDMGALSEALSQALTALQPDVYSVFIADEALGREPLVEEGEEAPLLRALFTRYDVPEDGLFYDDIHALDLDQAADRDVTAAAGRLASMAVMPLRYKNQPLGRVVLGYARPRPFDDADRRYLSALTESAAVVLDNLSLVEEIQSTLDETTVLYQAVSGLTEADDPGDILNTVVDYIIEPHVDLVFIALLKTASWDASGASAEVTAAWSRDDLLDISGLTLSAERFAPWPLLATASVLHIDDVETDPRIDEAIRAEFDAYATRSVMLVPLRVPNRMIGVLWIGSSGPHMHDDRELRVMQSFGEQASLSIEAGYLLQQTERRARQLETSAKVSSSAGQILNLEVLLPQLVDLIRSAFGYDHTQIFLMDEEGMFAQLRASTGEAGRQLLAMKHRLQRGSKSVIGQVTARGEPVIALDTADAAVVHAPNPFLPLTRSEMALPLFIKGKVIGALDVQSNRPGAFSADDVAALTTLAAQISIAIENANLYADAQTQADRMSLLFEITTAAAFAESLSDALNTVALHINASQGALSTAIYLAHEIPDESGENTVRMLQAAALAGVEIPLSELLPVTIGDEDNILGVMAHDAQQLIVEDIYDEPRYQPIAAETRAVMIVPMLSGGDLIGMIVLEDKRPYRYDFDELQLILTLAGSLSAIVQSTQLLERLQQANAELRELDRLKSDFLANMSHELRTPLNSIIGFSRVMLKGIDGPLSEMQEQDLTTIYNSGNHLLALINDILDQAKIAAGKMDIKPSFVEPKAIIDVVKSMAIGYMKDKPLQLFVEVAPNLPKIYADEIRLRQVLINLMSNAIKFTAEGSVTLRVYPYLH
ncbi:MAG TPA: GAF domain-containing protein, partial [Aggregatilineales bacterium]|nr:GAF domain-containing protein [Aggregatilineales bacterium]